MYAGKGLIDKITACWMGKNIGGTLGAPVEGHKEKLQLVGLPDLEGHGSLPNDDLDLQLVNLHTLEQRGLDLTINDFSEEWIEHVRFPFDEYGYALTNLRKGLVAPLSGYYNNPFTSCMGSPIRSELWASIAPGRPKVAAFFAYLDAMVDHSGGEGVYGEIFFAVLESLAYKENNIETLIDSSLEYIPDDSRVALAVKDTIGWYKSGIPYEEIRELILQKHGNPNFTDAPQNIAFTMVGLLYGESFADCLLKTVNLGYDTDCTAATLGSIYGILYGTDGIPDNWIEPVGENIKVSDEIQGLDYPKTITELTNRTLDLKQKIDLLDDQLFDIDTIKNYNSQVFYLPVARTHRTAVKVVIDGEDGPLCIIGKDKTLNIKIENNTLDAWGFKLIIRGENSEVLAESSMLTLDAEKAETVSFKVPVLKTENPSAAYSLTLVRYHDDYFWKEFKIDFALPIASIWEIDGNICFGDDGHAVLVGRGKHIARTTVKTDTERKVKFMFASSQPIKIYLDNDLVVQSDTPTDYIPAYHRGSQLLRYTTQLTSEKHTVTFEVDNEKELCEIMINPTTPFICSHHGNNYMNECIIGRE